MSSIEGSFCERGRTDARGRFVVFFTSLIAERVYGGLAYVLDSLESSLNSPYFLSHETANPFRQSNLVPDSVKHLHNPPSPVGHLLPSPSIKSQSTTL